VVDPGWAAHIVGMKAKQKSGKAYLATLVIPARGPVRMRKSGAGPHSSAPNRQRTRTDARRAALRDAANSH